MTRRSLALAAAGPPIAGLLAAGCGGTDRTAPPPTPTAGAPTATGTPAGAPSPTFAGTLIRVVVAGGRVANGVDRQQEVRAGHRVRIEVTSDRANELHVHGYDLRVELTPGRVGAVEFTADIPGAFEVELEDPRLPLFQLRVR